MKQGLDQADPEAQVPSSGLSGHVAGLDQSPNLEAQQLNSKSPPAARVMPQHQESSPTPAEVPDPEVAGCPGDSDATQEPPQPAATRVPYGPSDVLRAMESPESSGRARVTSLEALLGRVKP